MNTFLLCRTLIMGLLLVFNGIIVATGAYTSTLAHVVGTAHNMTIFFIVTSAINFVLLLLSITVDIFRRGALTSRVWFEVSWLGLFFVLHLAASSITTRVMGSGICTEDNMDPCASISILSVFGWLSTCILFVHLSNLLIAILYYRKYHSDIWAYSVTDFEWYADRANGKNVNSDPSSPVFAAKTLFTQPKRSSLVSRLEAQVDPERQQRSAKSSQRPALPKIVEPQPLTHAYAPEVDPFRAPVHYTARSQITIGAQLASRSQHETVPKDAPSLYPSHVVTAIKKQSNSSSGRVGAQARAPAAGTSTSQATRPIQNWPRQNPQEPLRTGRSRTVLPSANSSQGAVHSHSGSQSSFSSIDSMVDPMGPNNSGSRYKQRRPPPLNLSAISATRR